MESLLINPIKIGNKICRNRIVMPPMECRLNTIDGSPTQEMIDYYEARAKGGTGMIIVENTFVDNLESRSSVASSGLYCDHQIPAKAMLAEAITQNGALAILQLSHGGRQANPVATGLQCVAPSAIPCKVTKRIPRELSIEEIKTIETKFVEAAERAQKAGFDGVEIHCAHGYLLMEFLSPYSNKRTDEYGGNEENRMRMPLEIIKGVRERVGKNFIVGVRISVDEYIGEKGLVPELSKNFIKKAEKYIDYVHCSAGSYETEPFAITCSTYENRGKLVPLAEFIKNNVAIPVIAVGSLDADLGEKVIRDKSADLVSFGRQQICDPEFALKLTEGRKEDIRPCCRSNEGCTSGFAKGYPIRCELNPSVGRERRFAFKKTYNPKNIVVIGGGCAGMEATRVARIIGHNVTLIEKTDKLGGHMIEASIPPFKEKTLDALNWLIRQTNNSGAKIVLNANIEPEEIEKYNPDYIILAVGSEYFVPPLKGIENAVYADTALFEQDKIKEDAIIIGGGMVGFETAMTLTENYGVKTTIIEMMEKVSENMDNNARTAMIHRAETDGITLHLGTKVLEITQNGVICEKDGKTFELNAKNVIIAVGLKSNENEKNKYKSLKVKTIEIGDCKKARNISKCMYEAWCAILSL